MLRIEIPINPEGWDEKRQEFVKPKTQILQLEHSLVSLSKWESKWCKPFFSNEEKSYEEVLDYIKCMTITQNVDPEVYNHLTESNITDINNYINAPMTATTFTNDKGHGNNREIITSELVYYWMIALNIPVEFQKWHINRLLTLIRVCEIKSSPQKKMSKNEIMSRNAALNEARRKKLNSRG